MEDIADVDYAHAKRVHKDFKIKNLDQQQDLYLRNDVLFLADVFENFRKMCPEIYELDPAKLFFSPLLSMAGSLKRDPSKIRSNNRY